MEIVPIMVFFSQIYFVCNALTSVHGGKKLEVDLLEALKGALQWQQLEKERRTAYNFCSTPPIKSIALSLLLIHVIYSKQVCEACVLCIEKLLEKQRLYF